MTAETTRTCDQCTLKIDPRAVRVSASISVVGADGLETVRDYDFHSFAHLVAWAQTQPEPV